jgi:hypothetical protein
VPVLLALSGSFGTLSAPLFALALLAQMTPSPGPIAVPAGDAQATAPPAALPAASPGDALVRNSGSTNAPGYVFIVHPDATVDAVINGAVERKTIGHAQAAWLFARLSADAPLANVGGGCMRSASFGSTTTIAYGGEVTADLGCGGPAARELTRTIGIIRGQIGLATSGQNGRRPL